MGGKWSDKYAVWRLRPPPASSRSTPTTSAPHLPRTRRLRRDEPGPDYSAAYVVLRTDAADGHDGHGFAFTIGRGNDVQVAAIGAADQVVGRSVDDLCADPGTLSRDPVVIKEGHYTAPTAPGFSAAMRPESIARYTYPGGTFWAADLPSRKEQAQ